MVSSHELLAPQWWLNIIEFNIKIASLIFFFVVVIIRCNLIYVSYTHASNLLNTHEINTNLLSHITIQAQLEYKFSPLICLIIVETFGGIFIVPLNFGFFIFWICNTRKVRTKEKKKVKLKETAQTTKTETKKKNSILEFLLKPYFTFKTSIQKILSSYSHHYYSLQRLKGSREKRITKSWIQNKKK